MITASVVLYKTPQEQIDTIIRSFKPSDAFPTSNEILSKTDKSGLLSMFLPDAPSLL